MATQRIDKGPSGPVGIFFMALYLVGLLYFAPTLLTFVYLGITVAVIALVANVRRDRFVDYIFNNDWVLWSALGMFLVSWIMAGLNPLVPRDLIKGFWDTLWGVPKIPSTSSFVWGALWRTINWTFHGAWRTSGWADAAGTYFLWSCIAIFVSKWDESIVLAQRIWERGIVNYLLKDAGAELFWKVTGIFRK